MPLGKLIRCAYVKQDDVRTGYSLLKLVDVHRKDCLLLLSFCRLLTAGTRTQERSHQHNGT